MVAFLEEHTGRQLDIDRLREVIKESNKQYELWAEYNELRRAVPCPDGYKVGAQFWTMVQMLWPGNPKCAAWLENQIMVVTYRIIALLNSPTWKYPCSILKREFLISLNE
ncbi:MAG: 2-hydroxyacyl-CoA dehydratase [Chloroflexi bacterium]|nr:2-hydroxyacyl-CoA dehydratase [Chloroflexota bacterium]